MIGQEQSIIKKWSVPTPLQGHIFALGRIGSGKSCKLLSIVQGYMEKGYKVFDLFGGERGEGTYWCLKNDDHTLWNQLEGETYMFEEPGPKEYKVNILYPMFASKLPKKLPEEGSRVRSYTFTIPIKDIIVEDITLAIGPLGNESQFIWDTILRELGNKSNGADIKEVMSEKFPKKKARAIYSLFLRPLVEERLLANKYSRLNLDVVSEAQDRDTVTVLCLDYVPEKYKLFVIGYIMRKIFDAVLKNKIHKKNIAMLREVSKFMKVVDSDKSKSEVSQIFRNQLVNIARYGRSGLFLAMDTQSSAEVKGLIEGSDDLLCICEMPSFSDRDYTCKPLIRDKRMTTRQEAEISMLKIQEMYVIERGKRARKLKRVAPPRSRYFKTEYGSFYDLWKNEKGKDKFRDISEDIDYVNGEYSRRLAEVKVERIKKEDIVELQGDETMDFKIESRPDEDPVEVKEENEAISQEIDFWNNKAKEVSEDAVF